MKHTEPTYDGLTVAEIDALVEQTIKDAWWHIEGDESPEEIKYKLDRIEEAVIWLNNQP